MKSGNGAHNGNGERTNGRTVLPSFLFVAVSVVTPIIQFLESSILADCTLSVCLLLLPLGFYGKFDGGGGGGISII